MPHSFATPRRGGARPLAALVLALGALSACNSGDDVTAPSTQTITQIAAETPQLSTLVSALATANLADALDGGGPFTVFAPINDGFASLPTGTVDALLTVANRPILTELLQYHVVAGSFRAADLTDGQTLTTLAGSTLQVRVNGSDITVDGVPVITSDIEAVNGVVHLTTGVLTEGIDLVQRARVTPALESLVGAITAAGLEEALAGSGTGSGLTIFAPTNQAFEALGDDLPTDPAVIAQILQLHAAADRVLAEALSDGQQLSTLSGATLTVQIEGETVRLVGPTNTVTVVTTDLRSANGVLHLVNGVLLP